MDDRSIGSSAESQESDVEEDEPDHFFAVGKSKLVVMSVFTFGIYEIYWFYKHWQVIKKQDLSNIKPFWRAFFFPFTSVMLFRRIHDAAETHGIRTAFLSVVTAILVFVLNCVWRAPSPYWLLGFASSMVLVPVQWTAEQVNALVVPGTDRNTSYSGWNVAAIAAGAIVLLLAVIGAFSVK